MIRWGWDETEYAQPMEHLGYVKQYLWAAEVTSTLTGETFPVHYYVTCSVAADEFQTPEARQAHEEMALLTIRPRVEEAAAGWAYLPAWDREGLIVRAVLDVLETYDLKVHSSEHVQTWIRDAVHQANEEYEQKWAAAERLGAVRGDGFGWKIPIQPVPVGLIERP